MLANCKGKEGEMKKEENKRKHRLDYWGEGAEAKKDIKEVHMWLKPQRGG